jgi:cyanophycinase-like exopeptidase
VEAISVAGVTGLVLLQGGGEFSLDCRAMDKAFLERTDGPVVVTALASELGRQYRAASENGLAHLRALGASGAVVAPDVREHSDEALAVLRQARVIVLPGGSPSRLLTSLSETPVGALVVELVADGGAVLGASAGAMLLGDWTVLPEQRGPTGLAVVRGLGVVPGVIVVPHWSGGSSRSDWLRAIKDGVPADVEVLGLPEESGVVVENGVLTSVGKTPTTLVSQKRDLPLGESWRVP